MSVGLSFQICKMVLVSMAYHEDQMESQWLLPCQLYILTHLEHELSEFTHWACTM